MLKFLINDLTKKTSFAIIVIIKFFFNRLFIFILITINEYSDINIIK